MMLPDLRAALRLFEFLSGHACLVEDILELISFCLRLMLIREFYFFAVVDAVVVMIRTLLPTSEVIFDEVSKLPEFRALKRG